MREKLFLGYLFLICIVACDDRLDIEPEQSISTTVALSTDNGVKTALIGAYDLISRSGLWGGDIVVFNELYANTEDHIWTGFNVEINDIFAKNIFVGNIAIANLWLGAYETINQTNNVLSAIPVVNEADQAEVEGAARFIRAALYFDLVNLFGKTWVDGDPAINPGVPLITLPSVDLQQNAQVVRSSIAEIYDFIISDLQIAKANLPEENGFLLTTYAASALLTRVYLMQEKFDLAASESTILIDSDKFELVPDFSTLFNQSNNTSEDIFSIQFTTQDDNNNLNFWYAGEVEGGGGFITVSDQHASRYEPGDHRAEVFYFDAQNNTRRTAKWLRNGTNDGNVTIFRLAEIYLTRAECRFRLGDLQGAAEDLNLVRGRVGLPPLNPEDIQLETILTERSLELAFEGHQFRDIKRNRKDFGEIPYNDDRMVFPIPQRETDLNHDLIQNPGY